MIATNKKLWTLLSTGLTVMMLTALSPGRAQTPAQQYESLLGTWEVQTESASRTFIFEFFLEDGKLKGKYSGSAGTTPMDDLTFEKNLLRFSVTVNTMELDYSAVVDGDRLSGQVSLQYGQAEITGKKVRTGAE